MCLLPFQVKAAESAVFHVQTADVQEDGTMTATVYMTDTTELGGVDAELVYDASKVTYVDSEIGEGFTDGIGDINHLADRTTVKCLVIYPETKTAHGELMHVTFKLNDAGAYQPEFKIIDLVDGSLEISPIPYTITYQQSDGSWKDTPDTSGIAADKSVIAEAKKSYGAGDTENKSENSSIENTESKTEKEETEDSKEKQRGEKQRGEKQSEEKRSLTAFIVAAVILVGLSITIIYRRKRRKNEK